MVIAVVNFYKIINDGFILLIQLGLFISKTSLCKILALSFFDPNSIELVLVRRAEIRSNTHTSTRFPFATALHLGDHEERIKGNVRPFHVNRP